MSKKKQTQDEIENSDIMELITANLYKTESWKLATEAAVSLHKAAEGQRENEKLERQARREREKLEAAEERNRKELEAKNFLYNEEIPGAAPVVVPTKKPKKTKVIKTDGWVNYAVVDEEGKELEKPKPEEKPLKVKQQQPASVSTKSTKTLSNNIYSFDDDTENLPTQLEYQASLKDNKLKGQQQPPKNKRKNAKNKENGEKPKEVENKKAKEKPKVAKQPSKQKPQQQQLATNVPILQNELLRPLIYVFVFVGLISVVYLVLN
jgi:hypothetical protein